MKQQINVMLRQHKDILEKAHNLIGLLKAGTATNDPKKVKDALFNLSGLIKLHLQMEEEYLYPKLINHEDRDVRVTARKLKAEMIPITNAYIDYANKWTNTEMIASKSKEFYEETRNILQALESRIKTEDEQLYLERYFV